MTKWKAEIDAELGTEKKFHAKLEQQILQSANSSKSAKKYRYPATIIGACLVAILLFLTWPNNQPEQVTQTSFTTLDEHTKLVSPVSFYISDLMSDDENFLARANSSILGIRKYSSKDATIEITQMLQNAQLRENDSGWQHKDVVVKLDDDTLLKLKLYILDNSVNSVGILDIETKLYYVAQGNAAENILSMYYEGKIPYPIKIGGFVGFISLMLFLILNNKKRETSFAKIAPVALFLIIMQIVNGSDYNLAISIWLPILILIATAIIQSFILKRQVEYEKLARKQLMYAAIVFLVGLGITLLKEFGGFV